MGLNLVGILWSWKRQDQGVMAQAVPEVAAAVVGEVAGEVVVEIVVVGLVVEMVVVGLVVEDVEVAEVVVEDVEHLIGQAWLLLAQVCIFYFLFTTQVGFICCLEYALLFTT